MQIKETITKRWVPGSSAPQFGYDLTIPAGTPVKSVPGGQGPCLVVTATPDMLAEGDLRTLAEKPRSLFRFEATHHWVFVDASEVVQ